MKRKGKEARGSSPVLFSHSCSSISQEVSLAKRERGGPPSSALPLAVLQTCLQSVTAKAYASQESLRYWSKAVNHAL